jgi:bifunctional UDP-N-acetylglucosamine pyrophosphorylase / glucosamine-1-phosphate N-acetyltransferase
VTRAATDYSEDIAVVVQAEQKGTGHAVATALPALQGFHGKIVVLYGDTPFLTSETLIALAASAADVTVLGFRPQDPKRYGRLVTEGADLLRIVEFKDATVAERAITLCNAGILACDADLLADLVGGLTNDNAAGEYYLTDVIAAARTKGRSAVYVTCDEAETMGVDTRTQLAAAEAAFQAHARSLALAEGVTMTDPGTVWFAHDTVIGRDAVIGPNVVFGPGVTVETGAVIEAFCHLTGCHISAGATIGPFARLRQGAEIGPDVRVGNFVEIKNAVIDEGSKINHLAYVADAHVGDHVNIGAGVVTCNYDGVMKHRTEIGARAFIGSDTMLIAPVTIGADAMTASGSVITGDVPAEALALGRAQQVNKPGLAVRLMEKLRAEKARRAKGKA